MNFLAHTYLSFTDEQIVGNLIGDFIKNKKRDHLSEGIQQGITLHRAIDAFTDVHPKVLEAKTVFQPIVRLYSGAFVDVVFDYFLANDKNVKSAKEWRDSLLMFTKFLINMKLFYLKISEKCFLEWKKTIGSTIIVLIGEWNTALIMS